MNRLFFLVCLVLAGPACRRYSLNDELGKSTVAYSGEDLAAVKAATLAFIAGAENNEKAARGDPNLNYNKVLALTWLRLAGIYQYENNRMKYEETMARATKLFDKMPDIAADQKYLKDKQGALLEFLSVADSMDPPKWRKAIDPLDLAPPPDAVLFKQ